MNKLLIMIGAAAVAVGAYASSVTIDSVLQRWPWNTKVDIAYTVTGGQNISGGVFARMEFIATINGTTYTIDGNTIGASASDGSHVATWTAPADMRVKSLSCSMTAKVISADVPSGNDYMIVQLEDDATTGAKKGDVTYEGLYVDQAGSNARYNTDAYKKTKLVLRRIPRWSQRSKLPNASVLTGTGYPTGDTDNFSSGNSRNTRAWWQTDKDYYICIFPITQAQVRRIGPSGLNAPDTMVPRAFFIRKTRVRGDLTPLEMVPSEQDTFISLLNDATGLYFDLPTEVMFEIALRAGATTKYYWGADMDTDYVVCNAESTAAVGTKKPNDWGLYDMQGNVFEQVLDGQVAGDMADNTDAFTPTYDATAAARVRVCGGGGYNDDSADEKFYASRRGSVGVSENASWLGCRVAYIVK